MGEQPSDSAETPKPEVTNPANLAPVDPQQPRERREDIRAAIFETKLRRWALIGFVAAGALFWGDFAASALGRGNEASHRYTAGWLRLPHTVPR